MTEYKDSFDLGSARVNQTFAAAGDYISLEYTYTAGHPVDDSGVVKIVFRFAGDFGTPQFTDKKAPNFCTIKTTGDCRIEPRWDSKGNTRPWGRSLYLRVTAGYLNTGEKITVLFGDRAHTSPGWRMQTFVEKTFEFKTLVDPIATYQFKEIPKSPHIRIKPGKPVKAVCIAPSQVTEKRKFSYFLKLEDRWGNPIHKPQKLTHAGFGSPGVRRITAVDEETGLQAMSNPIRVTGKESSRRHWWADFHGQSEETIGSNTIKEYFTFARDYSLVDVAAHQGNDFQITDEFWDTINTVTKEFYKPGSFITFPGYEWSGNTPLGGDRNVYFSDEGGTISRSCVELLPGRKSRYKSSPTATALFTHLKTQRQFKPFTFAHVGGRYADIRMHDENIEVAVEIHSAWGTFEWLLWNAFDQGYRIGICANSDGHKGRPGASYPGAGKFGSYGGLTCLLAENLDRQSITDALFNRHFYATTGNRPLIDLKLETSSGREALMGNVIEVGADEAVLSATCAGTGPIERVDVFNGRKKIRTLMPHTTAELGRRIKIMWSGAEVEGRARMSTWDGSLTVNGNSIESFQPINFWKPDEKPQLVGRNALEWSSVTTGGGCGVILTLSKAKGGSIRFETTQKKVTCDLDAIKSGQKTWKCGGLEKKVEINRLPDSEGDHEYTFSLPLKKLYPGDNPIFIRVTQEDGHVAWTSPVYAVV